uniref:Amidase domain-containing protein n=1 Tax=Moniliophthora roreri TaxID=221103 RepID=A0A0W0FGS6_MONRR
MAALDWRAIAAGKKARQVASIPKEWLRKLSNIPTQNDISVTSYPSYCDLLSEKELNITNYQVDHLLHQLSRGELSAVEVTTAFCKRAVIAHQLTNCLTEIFIEQALVHAATLDEHFKKTRKIVGLLHGLPISLKDQVNVKGIESTMGYVSWVNKYAERNAVLVDILEAEGAVLYVKTNVPQTLMWAETFNHVFGRTYNPHNRSLTSGGSSGGEGALIALRGAAIGVGSDIGGQIHQNPFCVLWRLRLATVIWSILGPISNSIGGLKVFMKAVVDAQPWLKDPLAVRKRWSEKEYQLVEHGGGKKLCFAILWDDGNIGPHPPITRGLEMTKTALVRAGHKVIDWVPLKHGEIYNCLHIIWGAGAYEDYETMTAPTGEPIIESMNPELEGLVEGLSFRPSGGISAYQLWQAQKKRRDLREEYLQYWQNTITVTGTGRPVDAIISPVAPCAAPPHGQNKHANYTMVWNGLDYTSLVIPVSNVDQRLDVKRPRKTFYNDTDKAIYESYDPATFKNAPIAIQVIGRTLEEEAVIAMAEIVDTALKTGIAKL